MLRYRCWPCLALVLLASGCAVPSARDNAAAASSLVVGRVPAALTWRRDPEADRAAREQAEALLAGGLSVQEAIGVAFLTSPVLQLAFEQLEISRAELVAATRPANPVVVAGMREPGGDLAAFYPDRAISVGILQNVISLLSIPGRRAFAMHNIERVRFEVAQRASEHAAMVAEAWYRHAAARRLVELRERSVNTYRAALDTLAVELANDEEAELSAGELAAERVGLHQLENQLDRARMEAADERARLATLLGIAGWRDDWEIDGVLPRLPGSDPDAAASEAAAMTRRFDLLAAQKNIDMRLRDLATQRRFRWLTDLEIGMFRDKALGDTPFTGPTLALELPLWDQRQAVLIEADAELRSALRQLEDAALEARRQVRSNAATLVGMRRMVERYERDILPHHERVAADMGAGHPAELPRLDARLGMLEAQQQHVAALRDYWVARSALAQAAGDWQGLAGLQ